MQYLTRQRNDDTETWWATAIAADDMPIVVRELLVDRQVVAGDDEIAGALAWARTLPGWSDEDPPLVVTDVRS